MTHAHVPHRAVFPTADQVLLSEPWRETLAMRVLRNVRGAWRSPGGLHTSMGAQGAHAILGRGFLHLALVLSTQRVRDVLRADAGPEPSAPRGGAVPRYVSRAEIDAVTWSVPPADTAYQGSLRALRAPATMAAGTTRHLLVEVTRLGDVWWPWDPDAGRRPLRLGQRWLRADGSVVPFEAPRSYLPEPVAPGQTIRTLVALQAPAEPGDLVVTVDLVHELVRWFEVPVRLAITVTPR